MIPRIRHGQHFSSEVLAEVFLTNAGFVWKSEAVMGGGCYWRGNQKAFIEKSLDVFFIKRGKHWKVVTQ